MDLKQEQRGKLGLEEGGYGVVLNTSYTTLQLSSGSDDVGQECCTAA